MFLSHEIASFTTTRRRVPFGAYFEGGSQDNSGTDQSDPNAAVDSGTTTSEGGTFGGGTSMDTGYSGGVDTSAGTSAPADSGGGGQTYGTAPNGQSITYSTMSDPAYAGVNNTTSQNMDAFGNPTYEGESIAQAFANGVTDPAYAHFLGTGDLQSYLNGGGINQASAGQGGVSGGGSSAPSGGGSGSGNNGATTNGASSSLTDAQNLVAKLQQQISDIMAANNAAQLAEKIREYNATLAETVRQFDAGAAEKQREFNVTTQQGLLSTAAGLTGPKDYFQFLNYTNGGRNIIQSLFGDKALPAFQQPQGQNAPMDMQSLMAQLGIGGAQGQIGQAWTGTGLAQQAAGGAPQGLNVNGVTIPYGYQLNPAVWDSLGQQGQQFLLGAVSAAGFDPNVYEQQVNSQRPQGAAIGGTTTPTAFGATTSAYGTPQGSGNALSNAFSF